MSISSSPLGATPLARAKPNQKLCINISSSSFTSRSRFPVRTLGRSPVCLGSSVGVPSFRWLQMYTSPQLSSSQHEELFSGVENHLHNHMPTPLARSPKHEHNNARTGVRGDSVVRAHVRPNFPSWPPRPLSNLPSGEDPWAIRTSTTAITTTTPTHPQAHTPCRLRHFPKTPASTNSRGCNSTSIPSS